MSSASVWRRLLALAVPLWRGLLLALLLGALTVGTSVGLMATSAWLISKAAVAQSIGELGVAVVAVRFFGISRGVFRYLERLVSHGQTFRLLARIRVWFYEAIEPLAPAGLTRLHSGDLLDRVVADVDSLQDVFLRTLAPPLVALIVGTATVVLLCGFAPALGLTLMVFLLAGGIGVPLLAWRWSRSAGTTQVATRAELNARLVDTVQGMADLVAFGAEPTQLAALDALNESLREQDRRMARIEGAQSALNVLVVHVAALAVLAVAVPRVDGLYLAALTLATVAAFEAITPLAAAAQTIAAETAAARRLFELADQPAPAEPATSPQPSHFGLTVRNLSFRYGPDEREALHDLSFDVREGHTLAVVGASGAGKSTLVNLLLRFYDAVSGEIALGGQPISAYRRDDLYRLIAVVSQRTHLFNVPIAENLRIARPDATDTDLIEAAGRAQVHDFIASLPSGYETPVGEAGVHLSGGERQRIAIARALLRDAPILLLDEPTASLDSITERALTAALREAMRGRTTLIITHRLPTIVDANTILVLERGREVERGTHAELLKRSGVYARMWRLQTDVLPNI